MYQARLESNIIRSAGWMRWVRQGKRERERKEKREGGEEEIKFSKAFPVIR